MIFFCGDTHGRFGHLIEVVTQHRPKAVILLGDIEATQPLEQVLGQVLDKTEVWWIHGNHDTDSYDNYDNLFGSELADRNLHGRVVEIDGLKVAGLGGIFRGEIWYPQQPGAEVHYSSYADYAEHSEPGRIQAAARQRALHKGEMSLTKATGMLFTHRSTIFYQDWSELAQQRADILVTHEAPSCHPHGFIAIDELARAMGVKASFHGHQHDRLNYESQWGKIGFQAHGVGFCGVSNHYGGLIRVGEFDDNRMHRTVAALTNENS